MTDFRALVLTETDGKVAAAIEQVAEDRLPEGDVLVAVSHSDLNYKDGMILNGLGRLVRKSPHVPGVDFAGTVVRSEHRITSYNVCYTKLLRQPDLADRAPQPPRPRRAAGDQGGRNNFV